MSFLENIGWWKSKPPVPNPVRDHWETFSMGDKVKYFGNDAVVTAVDGYDDDDMPVMSLSYKDKNGKIHTDHLFPRDAYCLVVHADE